MVYLPKMGKSSYDEAKSFRPITLTTYLFKGLEKMVYWHLEDTVLKTTPPTGQRATGKRAATPHPKPEPRPIRATARGPYASSFSATASGIS